ncbi:MAG: osmotically inducible protein OsmC [Betaproteobacteria bacterium HGW-Betaproteobacteria-3]|jgi:putative redox protein|nr:MAG: osmotically inducible protein OsmC [Betaproteobacteria bacterium HGW-Betaproteobacteria-3]
MHIELQRVATGDGFAPMAQTLTVRGNTVMVDGTAAEGGDDTGPNPHDLYDAALGACKALTVLWYARRKGIPVGEVQTVVERDDSGERSGVYRLSARLKIGGDLSDAQLRELETVAGKCPVHKLMTAVTTEVTTSVERMA